MVESKVSDTYGNLNTFHYAYHVSFLNEVHYMCRVWRKRIRGIRDNNSATATSDYFVDKKIKKINFNEKEHLDRIVLITR